MFTSVGKHNRATISFDNTVSLSLVYRTFGFKTAVMLVDRDVLDDDDEEDNVFEGKLEDWELDKICSRSSAEAPHTKTVFIRRFNLESFS